MMRNAFSDAFENSYDKISLIGSDIMELTDEIIVQAFEIFLLCKGRATLSQCETALAAAEMLATMNSNFSDQLSKEIQIKIRKVKENLDFKIDTRLIEIAANVIDKIGSDSEMKDLWLDSEYFDNWTSHLIEIQNRLLN